MDVELRTERFRELKPAEAFVQAAKDGTIKEGLQKMEPCAQKEQCQSAAEGEPLYVKIKHVRVDGDGGEQQLEVGQAGDCATALRVRGSGAAGDDSQERDAGQESTTRRVLSDEFKKAVAHELDRKCVGLMASHAPRGPHL